MHVIGIDPGVGGAVALLAREDKLIAVEDMPTIAAGKTGRLKVNPAALNKILLAFATELAPDGESVQAVVELVAAWPRQGVASSFAFGHTFGVIEGVLASLGIPYHLVHPNAWKRHYRLGRDKEQSRALANRLFPGADLSRKQHHGRAEAMLLARYGYEGCSGARP